MTIDQINTAIVAGKFTDTELCSILESLKYAQARLARRIKSQLSVGDNVTFTHRGVDYTGHVIKIAVKNVSVRTVQGLYRVPAAMLTIIKD